MEIPLLARDGSLRVVAIVDDADWPAVSQHRWSYDGRYAGMNIGGGRRVRLHRFLMGEPPKPGLEVDHRDRDRLNNRRCNLRWSTHHGNTTNVSAKRGGTSAHRGVSWHQGWGKWRARATLDSREHRLGAFEREEDAAEAVRQFWSRHE